MPAVPAPGPPHSPLPLAGAGGAGPLIAGRYAIDPARPLPEAGGGLAAFAVIDHAGGEAALMAVQVPERAAARPLVLAGLPDAEGILRPLAHGPGDAGKWFVICPAPPGRPLWPVARPWTEAEIFALLLRPVAAALEVLGGRGVTHRAIRPDNLFRAAAAAAPVVLGCAWAAPPAMHQPAAFEAPGVAMCLAAGRGEGSAADDVYALGVTALALALGRMPWAGLADDELIRRKLEHGSFAALAGEARLPPGLAELLRAMLAEDPAQRPSVALLLDPDQARGRRAAVRPVRKAQRALLIGALQIWDIRSLAYALARDRAALRLLQDGRADHWLRRALDDGVLASRLEELARRRLADHASDDAAADALLLLRAIAVLDPLAPLCWQGVAVWPDGIGAALAVHGEANERLAALVVAEAPVAFAAMRGEAEPNPAARAAARAQRALLQRRGWSGGAARLCYALNPLLPCRSALVGGVPVARLADVLPALDMLAAGQPRGVTLDGELVAFIAARQEHGMDGVLSEPASPLAALRILAGLQTALRAGRLPALAAALAAAVEPAVPPWHSRARQAAKQRAAAEASATGDLAALLAVLDDAAARRDDTAGLRQAAAAASRIDAALAALDQGAPARSAAARALGQEIAGALALAALAASGVAALLQ